MKTVRIITIFLAILLFYACSREESTLNDYRALAKELKVNSTDYTPEEWEEVINKYERLEKETERCHFSKKEKKELNRLRGQCAAYILKSVTKQTKQQIKDAIEQFSDMAEGFKEGLGEEGLEGLFKDEGE